MNRLGCLRYLLTAVPLALLAVASSAQEPSDPAPAKPGGQDSAIEAAASAQQLEAMGDWKGALKVLEDTRIQCGESAEGRPCQEILDYSLGYVLQQSSADGPDPEGFLRQAAAAYEKVLAQTPAHGPSIDNLVSIYQRLGEPDRAVRLLQEVLASNPVVTSKLAIQLGDALLQANSPLEARKIYSEILEKDPYNAAVGHRLVSTYESAPSPTGAKELLDRGKQWDSMFPGAARHAYEAAIRITYQSNPSEAEGALVLWVDLLGRSSGISTDDLESLPSTWQSAALLDLRVYLDNPGVLPAEDSWWQDHGEHSVALARASLSLGKTQLNRGDVKRAEAIWCVGRDLATPGQKYREGQEDQEGSLSPPDATIDLQTELALLYFNYPQLDRGGKKFQKTEMEFFREKGQAYEADDLPSIQRYHEALGLIYAQRGIWEGKEAHGALDQLWSALDAAAERDNLEGIYQPLPSIRERLADGFSATGYTRLALSRYLDACEAYLEVDDLAKAETMLSSARKLSSALVDKEKNAQPTDEETQLQQLSQVLPVRRRLEEEAGSTPQKLQILPRPILEYLDGSPWLDPAWPYPRKSFIGDQRFKALADLAFVAARDSGTTDLSLSYAVRAMEMALDGPVTLVGAGDLVRLQRIQALIAEVLGLELEEPRVVPAAAGSHSLYLALPGGGPTFVLISEEAELASRIVNRMGVAAALAMHPTLRIHGGAVVVMQVHPGTDLKSLLELLQATRGAESVAVADALKNP